MARQLGFNIKTASDGPSALMLMDGGKLPNLLITDYDMPGMTGVELAKTITRRRADVDVLIITGHDKLDEELPDKWQLLHKPFTAMTLAHTLESFGIKTEC